MNKLFKNKYLTGLLAVLIIALVAFVLLFSGTTKKKPSQKETTTVTEPQTTTTTTTTQKVISEPINNAKSRVTKKPFGIYINPQTSPVQPERFTGYHTGTDFETTVQESNSEVPVYAICSGRIQTKQIVSGYGGVIVQDCTIEGQPVTVLYGHIDLRPAFEPLLGQEVVAGTQIAILAPANSEYSSGERKHLHLGIHKGTEIDYRGYVQNQSEISGWLDVGKYL